MIIAGDSSWGIRIKRIEDQRKRNLMHAPEILETAGELDFSQQRPVPVENLIPDLVDVNAFRGDAIASDVIAHRAPWAKERAVRLGGQVWDPTVLRAADDAQRYIPELRTLDRLGNEVFDVKFHPSYHQLMSWGFGAGVHSLGWTAEQPGGHSARAVLSYLWNQIDGSTACPTGMAYASIPVLRSLPELSGWAAAVSTEGYDPRDLPIQEKTAATIGYFMTEKQGGSDLRANVTVARPMNTRGPGETYLLNGHKWFASVPMSDGFLTVAQTLAGVSCFLVPRRLPDGELNHFTINRLKDKLGNRANASSEIEYHGAHAILIGEEGRGIKTILSSAEYTRLDFAIGSAGLMRAALSQAMHFNDRRETFGVVLSENPIQSAVLADLALEWAGASVLGFAVAAAEDHQDQEAERLFSRLMTPVAKYWNCRRAPGVVEEAIQSIGGNAFIEEHPLPRYYREAPLNSIWEGTSNMMVMDVTRVLTRQPEAFRIVQERLQTGALAHTAVAGALAELALLAQRPEEISRYFVTRLALVAQAVLLLESAPTEVAEAFIATRLRSGWGPGYGSIRGVDNARILEFARI
ncbi:acyl-CoA dehydrogenase family protein [Leucobacter sp. M11]|uniref:acyl-CoA dehydrogenase family protein n=1 Tax=Leucobacter sp. M11 TaxID=2993565 RepID=UPI002D7F550A|nr:acyl-CoA dehydrogenase family protein [Leucobacter sp. M11]MEB4615379.1 acyl-CoA dehydrogenase family protein [Leucobacter sp. M11]